MAERRAGNRLIGLIAGGLLAGMLLLPVVPRAQDVETVVDGMKTCLAIDRRKRRLACFEDLARRTIERTVRHADATSPSPSRAPAVSPAPAATPAAASADGAPAGRDASPMPVGVAEKGGGEVAGTASSPPAAAASPAAERNAASTATGRQAEIRRRYGLKQSRRDEPRRLDVVITAAWPDARGRWNFETADGQIWRQRDKVRVRLTRLPVDARIEKSLFGSYFLDIRGVPSDIRVERRR